MEKFSQPHTAITPAPLEILELHQLSYDFYQEVQSRDALEEYCQWYYAVAEQHRQEFQQMQQEVNLFRLFRRNSG